MDDRKKLSNDHSDSRPSLDLTDEQVQALLALIEVGEPRHPAEVEREAIDALRAELARRQGTGQ